MGKIYTVTVPADAVRDKDGNPNTQYSFSFSTPFLVMSTNPANGATGVPVDQAITVILAHNGVQGPNFNGILLKKGSMPVQSAVSINGNVLTIIPASYLDNDDTYTVTIPHDSVRDEQGHPNGQYNFGFTTRSRVTITSPAHNVIRFPTDQAITVNLSENGVQGPAFNSITLKAGATTVQSTISLNANVLTIAPAANLANDTVYTVTIPADSIRNAEGVSLNAYSFSFRTLDIVPPAVSSASPANGATNVAVGTTINVNLSEDTATGPNFGGITLKDSAGNTVNVAIDYYRYWDDWEWAEIVDTRVIVIDPAVNLETGKTYIVTIPADAVRDKDGNPNVQYSLSFSTPL
jgi:methionine-rich copper-binding protein CopC